MGLYSRFILPPLLSMAMGAKPITYQRKKIVPEASGTVLEIGAGAGHNFPFYDARKVSKVIALEPAAEMVARAKKRLKDTAVPVEFIGLEAERIPLPDASVDTVLVTYTLCTIPDAATALAGMVRVLKPGGAFLFCEHGAAPDEKVARWQRRIEPVWKRIAGGCHLCRPVPDLIKGAGLAIDRMETMYLPGTPRFAGFNYWGRAHRA